MTGIRAKYIHMTPTADDGVKFIFKVEKEHAQQAAAIMGMPIKSIGGKDYNIIPHIDEATPFYQVEEPNNESI